VSENLDHVRMPAAKCKFVVMPNASSLDALSEQTFLLQMTPAHPRKSNKKFFLIPIYLMSRILQTKHFIISRDKLRKTLVMKQICPEHIIWNQHWIYNVYCKYKY